MKPGATTLPDTSRRSSADASERSPMAATRSPRMPTSATNREDPEPSIRSPPARITSKCSLVSTNLFPEFEGAKGLQAN